MKQEQVFFVTPKMVGSFVAEMQKVVEELEQDGTKKVYWPWRDDPKSVRGDDGVEETALHICKIAEADTVYLWHYYKSQAVHYLLGVAAAFGKPIVIVEHGTPYDSKFYKLLKSWNMLLKRVEERKC